jgi:oligosaccharide amylase
LGRTYFNHGITGNGRLLATFTNKGELNRIFWPGPDYYQHINNVHAGIKFDESNTKFLHDNIWYVEQYYEPRTNILVTMYENSDIGIRVYQKDFALNDKDVLVRNYKIENISSKNINMDFFLYTDFVSEQINIRNGFIDFDRDCSVIYNKESAVVIGTNYKLAGFQFGNAKAAVTNDSLYGKDDISMTSDLGLKWKLGEIKANEKVEFNLYFTFAKDIDESIAIFDKVKNESVNFFVENTKKYWNEYFLKFKDVKTGNDKIDEIYNKSLLVFSLFTSQKTGAILAAAEIDENFTRCGRYGYCWPRDGVFITKAFDICGMTEEAEKFYTIWAKKAHLNKGQWQQRYFLDGTLGPSWGVQIDETASIIYGIWEHYAYTKNILFLENMWDNVKLAADFLAADIDEETGLPKVSYDLWEERLGEHTYSAAAVVGGLIAASKIAEELKIDTPLSKYWLDRADYIKKNIEEKLWSNTEKRFLRGIRTRLNWWNCGTVELNINELNYKIPVAEMDLAVDISLLGLAVPFNIFDIKDEKIKKTVRAIEERLDGFPSGGYGRYEYDSYIGGNPWIVATLWLSLYYIESGELERGRDLFMWAVKHCTSLGFLPEQVDKLSGDPAWVMQLSWSHAMFVIILDKLRKK